MHKLLVTILVVTIIQINAVPFGTDPQAQNQQYQYQSNPTPQPQQHQQDGQYQILPVGQGQDQQQQQQPATQPLQFQSQDSQQPHQFQTRDIPASDPTVSSSTTTFSPNSAASDQPQLQEEKIQNDSIFCTKDYVPICGSNGQTYSNNCMLNLARRADSSLTAARSGEC